MTNFAELDIAELIRTTMKDLLITPEQLRLSPAVAAMANRRLCDVIAEYITSQRGVAAHSTVIAYKELVARIDEDYLDISIPGAEKTTTCDATLERMMEDEEFADRIGQILELANRAGLTHREYHVVVARLRGCEYREIAQVLAISEASARSYVSLGLAKIRAVREGNPNR